MLVCKVCDHSRYTREEQANPIIAPPPAFVMRSVAAGWRVYKLPDVPVRHFAEQLTRMDVVSPSLPPV